MNGGCGMFFGDERLYADGDAAKDKLPETVSKGDGGSPADCADTADLEGLDDPSRPE